MTSPLIGGVIHELTSLLERLRVSHKDIADRAATLAGEVTTPELRELVRTSYTLAAQGSEIDMAANRIEYLLSRIRAPAVRTRRSRKNA